ncbi:MAG: right-handed parallel beta-helix repeat-containing protein [Planctomycetota bacterium]
MKRHLKITFSIIMVLAVAISAYAARSYTYVLTVNMNPNEPGYDANSDYDTINDAIVAMNAKSPGLDANNLGCISLYAERITGYYLEHLNNYYDPNGHNLPAHCDLIGMEDDINDVEIRHTALYGWGDMYQPGIKGDGDNIIANLKVQHYGNRQNSVLLSNNSVMDNCIVNSGRLAIDQAQGANSLTVQNCIVSSMYASCIRAWNIFDVYNCDLNPQDSAGTTNIESPGGIYARGPGIIEGVCIHGIASDCYDPNYGGLYGIHLQLDANETVLISDVQMDLELTSVSGPSTSRPLRVCGLLSGKSYGVSDNSSLGCAIVRDCQIAVTGIESSGDDPCDPNDDGAGVKVDGILNRGGGTIEVWGYSDIVTDRTSAAHEEDGYEYSLNNENGTLIVDTDANLVSYDANKVNGTLTDLTRAVNITRDVNYPSIQNAINDANGGDVIEIKSGIHYEPIDFNDKQITIKGSNPNDWDVVESTIIEPNSIYGVLFACGEDANSILTGVTVQNASNANIRCENSSSPVIDQCIIRDSAIFGIWCVGGSAEIYNNKIYGNDTHGIWFSIANTPKVKNNWIFDNSVFGMFITLPSSTVTITNNTLTGNIQRGISFAGSNAPSIANCIVWDNNDDLFGCSATYSCVEDGDAGTGNISSNPLFVDPNNENCHIAPNSPCIDMGDPNGDYSGQYDIDGDNRVIDGIQDGNSVVDMGADEYDPNS